MSEIEKKYTAKIFVLIATTCFSIFIIWYALIRQESVDWLSSQISHQVSPYIITEDENGFFVENTLLNYGFNLPEGFKTNGAKNLTLFIEDGDQKKCEIKHFYFNNDKAKNLVNSEINLIITAQDKKLVFELVNANEQNTCKKYLSQINKSFIAN